MNPLPTISTSFERINGTTFVSTTLSLTTLTSVTSLVVVVSVKSCLVVVLDAKRVLVFVSLQDLDEVFVLLLPVQFNCHEFQLCVNLPSL